MTADEARQELARRELARRQAGTTPQPATPVDSPKMQEIKQAMASTAYDTQPLSPKMDVSKFLPIPGAAAEGGSQALVDAASNNSAKEAFTKMAAATPEAAPAATSKLKDLIVKYGPSVLKGIGTAAGYEVGKTGLKDLIGQ